MYLLLAENNFISSREIKNLLDKYRISCEIVNCSSASALLDIAEKINPDIVIVDFDLFIDESVNIVRQLRRHSAGAYILAFIDPDHYSMLHRAIEDGIDNYMIKPLQREDVLLRIKMGLQHQSSRGSARLEAWDVAAEPEQKTPPVHEETAADSKLMFEELVGFFNKQFENGVGQPESSVEIAEETGPDLPDLTPLPESDFSWPGTGTDNSGDAADSLQVDLNEEPAVMLEAEGQPHIDFAPDLETPVTISASETAVNDEQPKYGLIDEAFLLVDNMEDIEVVKTAGGSFVSTEDLKQKPGIVPDSACFDNLFNREPIAERQAEAIQISEGAIPQVDLGKPETVFEKEPELPEDKKPLIDDKELFGMATVESAVDRSSFEELFGDFGSPAKKQKRVSVELTAKKGKEAKVEYLPFARKQDAASSIPAGELEAIFTDLQAVPGKPKKQKGHPQKTLITEQKSLAAKPERSGSKFLRAAGNLATALLLFVMVGLSFFLIQNRLSGGSPAVAGYQVYVVLSGSMNPAFDTGSIVFVKPTEPAEIAEGDIITFRSSGDSTRLTTHRVVGMIRDNGLSFVTRGDANNINDPNPVPSENVVGRVTGSVPYIGYLFGYAQTRQGLIMLIFIPGLFIIMIELRRLFKHMVEAKVKQLSSGSAATGPASSGSFYASPAAGNRMPLPGSEHERSLEDFGF